MWPVARQRGSSANEKNIYILNVFNVTTNIYIFTAFQCPQIFFPHLTNGCFIHIHNGNEGKMKIAVCQNDKIPCRNYLIKNFLKMILKCFPCERWK